MSDLAELLVASEIGPDLHVDFSGHLVIDDFFSFPFRQK
jgi:hypothetical protein